MHKLNIFKQFVEEKWRSRIALADRLDCTDELRCLKELSEDERMLVMAKIKERQCSLVRCIQHRYSTEDFELLRHIGTGAFGVVSLASCKRTGQQVALKQIRKDGMLKKNHRDRLLAERALLSDVDTQWVVTLFHTFQDHINLYMVMEYLPGGDLMSHLIRLDRFSEAETRFYISQLVEAVHSVHRMGFIHRDIKPDNIVLTKSGHIKLIDCGLCKFDPSIKLDALASDERVLRSSVTDRSLLNSSRRLSHGCRGHLRSSVGTPQYMAPEVLNKAYDHTSDFWSVGMIAYECMMGGTPFFDESAETRPDKKPDVKRILHKVVNYKEYLPIPFPGVNVSGDAASFLKGLLCDASVRMRYDQIRAHAFFKTIKWDRLHEMPAPILPRSDSSVSSQFSMSSKVALSLPERTSDDAASRIENMEAQLREQSEVIQSLFDAFKLLAEENVKKEKRIEKIEAINNQSKELISMHLVDGLDVIKRKIEHIDKIQELASDLEKLKSGLEDVRFAVAGGTTALAVPTGVATPVRDRSPSPNKRLLSTPPLPFATGEQPAMGLKGTGSDKISQIQSSIESVLGGIEYIARQRNADVQSINSSLENLDRRIKLLAGSGSTTGSATGTPTAEAVGAQSVIGYVSSHRNFNLLMNEIRGVKDQVIPDLESEWASKWGILAGKIELVAGELKRGREEFQSYQEKSIVREAKLSQILSSTENSKRFGEKSEQLAVDMSNRVLKLEADTSHVFDELKRVEDGLGQLVVLESKQDLSRSECKSNWERVARQNKQDIDALRIKVERVAVVKDEFERINAEVKNLHEVVASASSLLKRAERVPVLAPVVPVAPSRPIEQLPRLLASTGSGGSPAEPFVQFKTAPSSDNPPPLVQATQSISTSNDSSILSMMDDGIGLPSEGIVASLSNENQVVIPIGGAEAGALRFDASTGRVLWRIENVASMIREPNRYPKIIVSPEFIALNKGVPDAPPLIGRMKLFPQGSDQSRVQGNCSFYLRCMPGIVVRYAIDIGGEVMDVFECEYEKQRDKGKHDFVKLNEYTNPDGSATIGIEIKAINARGN